MIKLLPDLDATLEAARAFMPFIQPGQVVYLQGELGAGKTTFVQGLLKAWGFEGSVRSPTYTLVEPYPLSNFTVFHFDFYRLKNSAELAFIGIREYFTSNSIAFIEWPERAEGEIPKADWLLQFSYEGDGRKLEVA